MASRQLLRRLSPLLRNTLLRNTHRLTPGLRCSRAYLPRHAVISQNLTARLSGARLQSTVAEAQIINIQDEEEFQKHVMDSAVPVIVDFHATWCGPCKLLGPRLETIVAGEQGKVVVAKVDIDENVELAMRYNVQSVPTVYGVKNGKIVSSFIGLKDDDEIKSFVRGLL
ncbi:hypothetical protein BaRGS_00014317 [Batillaria attramentaria]|uniref:Thioredoxin domain-containing protein n=1 Tax=Batillaria attramentaria TaxID=370345 RepID=A0ABD0L5K0_9CAEN